MKKNAPVEKNKKYKLEITSQGYEGEGVAKIDNFPIFIKGALKGEEVEVHILKVSKNYAYGKLAKIIKPSEARVVPKCEIYEKCGGCQLQHYSYEAQLDFKRQRIVDVLERIGKVKNPDVKPVLGMEHPYRYRNKVQHPIGREEGKINIGFYAERSHRIIDVKECIIQNETADKVVKLVREFVESKNISTYDEETGTGVLRHIMIREGFHTGQTMVVIVTNGKELPYEKEFIELITENIPTVKSIIHNINSEKTNVVLGLSCRTIWGEDTITDKIGDFFFKISPLSFFQVNPLQTEVLYGKALEFAGLTGEETVFDAYCGAGTISLFLAKKAKKVYGVEIIPEAIENAKENAQLNKIENVDFLVGESEVVIPKLINEGVKADIVVVDPPRKGCDIKLLEAIAEINPERIVYVSCDPATLARDVAILGERGYEVREVQGVDMFPMTGHVEAIILMTRSGSGEKK